MGLVTPAIAAEVQPGFGLASQSGDAQCVDDDLAPHCGFIAQSTTFRRGWIADCCQVLPVFIGGDAHGCRAASSVYAWGPYRRGYRAPAVRSTPAANRIRPRFGVDSPNVHPQRGFADVAPRLGQVRYVLVIAARAQAHHLASQRHVELLAVELDPGVLPPLGGEVRRCFPKTSRSIFTRVSSARGRTISIRSRLTGFVPAPPSRQSLSDLILCAALFGHPGMWPPRFVRL